MKLLDQRIDLTEVSCEVKKNVKVTFYTYFKNLYFTVFGNFFHSFLDIEPVNIPLNTEDVAQTEQILC